MISVKDGLKKLFGVSYTQSEDNIPSNIIKLNSVSGLDSELNSDKINLNSEQKELLDLYVKDTKISSEFFKNMAKVYKEMEDMYYNCSIISRAIELVVDEVIQVDSNTFPILVDAKDKTKKKILDFFNNINVGEKLRPIISDIVLYGNALVIPSFSKNKSGINKIILKDVYSLKRRLEFCPKEVEEKYKNKNTLLNNLYSVNRLDTLIDNSLEGDDLIKEVDNYLLGYQVYDTIYPPWRVIHFRNTTNKSPFAPFGVPIFIHSLGPYKQYSTMEMYKALLLAANFPKKKYTLYLNNIQDPTEKVKRASQFIRKIQNSGLGLSSKETGGIDDVIVTIKDLYDFEMESPDIELTGNNNDIESQKDNLIISSMVPRSLIDPNDSGFGDSGVSLIQKWKPFGRLVYRIQDIVIKQFTLLVKLHMLHSKDFTEDDFNFTLSMPYPESQIDRDLIDNQNDLLDLANNIIDALQDKLLDGETLPSSLIASIYKQFLPYDDDRIDKWFKDAEVDKMSECLNIRVPSLKEDIEAKKKWKIVESKDKTVYKTMSDTIYELKSNSKLFLTGKFKGRHFCHSSVNVSDFDFELFKKETNSIKNNNKLEG